MRVSVINFCSTALDLLDYSTSLLMQNAGTDDYDYIIVTWNPSPEVAEWIAARPYIQRIDYETDFTLDYVPNLRQMFNKGFDVGYDCNDYVCIVNSDCALGHNWLVNLMRRATEDIIPNSLHLSPIEGTNIITVNLGIPTADKFDKIKFDEMCQSLSSNRIDTEESRGGWRATQTLPYIIHKKWWDHCGPWGTEFASGAEGPPDHLFFKRCHDAGAKYVLCWDSICYHHEAVERRSGRRPLGCENMPEGR